MIRFLICITTLLQLAGRSFGATEDEKYTLAIQRILREYPAATLRDIYKSFFQDQFGPGHIVADTAAAHAYLRSELAAMEADYVPIHYFEPAGVGDNFYRVDLSIIRDGVIEENDFFAAFMQSAEHFTLPDVAQWKLQWESIMKSVPDTLPGFEADRGVINALLESGRYVRADAS